MKSFKRFLKEDPDYANVRDLDTDERMIGVYHNLDAYPFLMFGDKMYVGPAQKTHSDTIDFLKIYKSKESIINFVDDLYKSLVRNKKTNADIFKYSFNIINDVRDKMKKGKFEQNDLIRIKSAVSMSIRYLSNFPGRFWKDKKIISFWKYPKSQKEFDMVVKLIRKESGVKIDGSWIIDLTSKDDPKGGSLSVKEYRSSKVVKQVKQDLEKIHLLPAAVKKKFLDKVKGFGSDKQAEITRKAGFRFVCRIQGFHTTGKQFNRGIK